MVGTVRAGLEAATLHETVRRDGYVWLRLITVDGVVNPNGDCYVALHSLDRTWSGPEFVTATVGGRLHELHADLLAAHQATTNALLRLWQIEPDLWRLK